jgi:hypothetical protein
LDNALVGLTESARSPDDFRQEAVRTDEKGEKLISVGNGDHNARSGRGRTVLEYAELQTWAEGRKHHLEKAARDHAERQGVEREARCIENEDAWEGHPSQAKLGDMVEGANRVIAQLLEIADGYRTTCHKALNLARAAVSLPSKPANLTYPTTTTASTHLPPPQALWTSRPPSLTPPIQPARSTFCARSITTTFWRRLRRLARPFASGRSNARSTASAERRRSRSGTSPRATLRFSCRRVTRQGPGLHSTVRGIPEPPQCCPSFSAVIHV